METSSLKFESSKLRTILTIVLFYSLSIVFCVCFIVVLSISLATNDISNFGFIILDLLFIFAALITFVFGFLQRSFKVTVDNSSGMIHTLHYLTIFKKIKLTNQTIPYNEVERIYIKYHILLRVRLKNGKDYRLISGTKMSNKLIEFKQYMAEILPKNRINDIFSESVTSFVASTFEDIEAYEKIDEELGGEDINETKIIDDNNTSPEKKEEE